MIDNTEKIEDDNKASENPEIEEIKKWNTKLVTPVIVLFATSIIAIYSFIKHYPVGDWFVIVCSSVIIFLIIGFIIERMISKFVDINYEKAIAEMEEARRLEEEARAAMEAEGGDESGMIQDDNSSEI